MSPTTETKTLGFIFGSGLLHVTTVAAISLMNLQPQKPKIEMIEFEVTASQGVQTEVPAAAPAPAEETVAAEKPVAQVLPQKTIVAQPEQALEEPTPAEVSEPVTIAETTTPAVAEESQVAAANESTEATETVAAAAVVADTTDAVAPQTEVVPAQTTEVVEPPSEAASAPAEEVASVQAAGAMASSQTAASEQPANGTQDNATGAAFGVAEGIRQLEQLKQRPGNKKPSYDKDDRLRGRQGKVSLLAYISRDGRPVQFKMLQSSGHRSLDLKTLAAVRTWRFYPGQEGWVEIPIQWDLRGGPQEAPATLRRQGIIN